jgi:hypothetical protein
MIYGRLTLVAAAILVLCVAAHADETAKGQVLGGGAPIAKSTVTYCGSDHALAFTHRSAVPPLPGGEGCFS